MESMQSLRRLLDYDHWANRETLASLQRQDPAPVRASRLMAHIVATEWLWMSRLELAPSRMPVWPELPLAQCETELAALPAAWQQVLSAMTPARFAQPVSYRNSLGEAWSSTPEEILTHIVLHSSYHRGQIATVQRQADQNPAYTDYIHCARQGFLR